MCFSGTVCVDPAGSMRGTRALRIPVIPRQAHTHPVESKGGLGMCVCVFLFLCVTGFGVC
jgi:hypothetical protein